MENSTEDNTELVRSSKGDEDSLNSSETGYYQLDLNHCLIPSSKRRISDEEPVSVGSIHALQTAFTALQRKHNATVKRNTELSQMNRSFHKALMDLQGGRIHANSLDEMLQQETSSVLAAGGTSDGNDAEAEIHAQQGLIQCLRRDKLMAENTIKLLSSECDMFKNKILELELTLSRSIQERERLQIDKDNLIESQATQDAAIADLQEELKRVQFMNQQLQEALGNDKNQRLYETKFQELQTKLTVAENERKHAENERKHLRNQVAELQQQVQAKEKERSILEVQNKQLKIESDIRGNHKHKQEAQDDMSDETDVKVLQEALNILSNYRTELSQLKQKCADQQGLVQQIQSIGKRQSIAERSLQSLRGSAQGASINTTAEDDEHYTRPFERNSTLLRSNSDHSDFRQHHQSISNVIPAVHTLGINPSQLTTSVGRQQTGTQLTTSFVNQQTGTQLASAFANQQTGSERSTRSSTRVPDNILPTGNRKVPPMYALESNTAQKTKELASAIQTGSVDNINLRTRSPEENYNDVRLSHLGPRQIPVSQRAVVSPRLADSPRTVHSPRIEHSPRFGEVEYANFSPRTQEQRKSFSQEPNQYNMHMQGGDYLQGARMKLPTSNANNSEVYVRQNNHILNNMTQSEIILKEHSSEGNHMTRSVHGLLQPLNIPLSGSPGIVQGEMTSPNAQRESASPLFHRPQPTAQNAGPDYENIYNIAVNSEVRRPVEEHDEERTSPRPLQGLQEEGREHVSDVKICPVCNQEFSRLTLNQFQMHVVECFDTNDESPATLQAVAGTTQEEDRTCPMCTETFPLSIPQETYEQHVLSHFGEDPMMDCFEMIEH